MAGRVRIGVMGLGRMGRVYASYLAHRVPNAELVAVADNNAEVARGFADEFAVPQWFASNADLLADGSVDAVAVLTPTQTHKQAVLDAAGAGKAVFCEKPMAMTIADAEEMLAAVAKAGVLFQPGFMRRFDSGYVEAKKKLDQGVIGTPVVFTSISRDPYRPSLEFCDPAMSGGLIADMGIHDFDLARVFMGEVARVHSIGTTLAYPEMKTVGDIDNAVVSLTFKSEALGSVLASRNAVFGYDIRTEIWGTKGSLQIGYHRQTPVMVMTKEGISHDAVPYFMERFEGAYLAQIQSFVDAVQRGREPAVSGADAVAAMRISVAATESLHTGATVVVG
ncbi:MAG: Gfo/Idh/MocA family oxidoreductase [Acidobacteriota bacterium]